MNKITKANPKAFCQLLNNNEPMWKNILTQLNAAIFANWKWLFALLVGIVLGAANCGGVADLVPLADVANG